MNTNPTNFRPDNVIPMVSKAAPRGERVFDIYSLLLRERIIFLGSAINDQVANVIIAQLLFLDGKTRSKTSTCTSTPPAVSSLPAWPFMIPCSLFAAGFHHLRRPGRQHGHRASLLRRQR